MMKFHYGADFEKKKRANAKGRHRHPNEHTGIQVSLFLTKATKA